MRDEPGARIWWRCCKRHRRGIAATGLAALLSGYAIRRLDSVISNNGKVVTDPQLACAQSWKATRLAWIVGYALLSDRGVVPLSCGKSVYFRRDAFLPISAGDVVFVRASHLPRFFREVLPAVGNASRFALVTADAPRTDHTLPGPFLSADETSRVLDHPAVAGWWSTNSPHPRVRKLPLGIDFHDGARHGRLQPDVQWGHLLRPWALYSAQASPAAQEATLLEVARSLRPTRQRELRAFADFQFERSQGHRQKLWRRLQRGNGSSLVVAPPRRLPRAELWRLKGRYMFDISPRGRGLDCYRTWESLALGMIVIVERSPLDSLYDGLPVVVVDDLAAITDHKLRRWAVAHLHGAHATVDVGGARVPERVTAEYWMRTLRAAATRTTQQT